ncbi:MAG TPA: dTDP-4-dehydrorhamnose reductase [Burkholderiales bacterium]
MLRILLTGSSGQVGWELTRTLMPLGRVVTPGKNQFNLAQPESLGAFVNTMQPDVIVNAAAYTAVDKAEQEPDLAFAVNAAAPSELAKAARRHNALLVHYSTDYVFDGKKPGAYSEENVPNPISAYGRSKLAGDEAVRASGADHLIFRTSWVFAARGKNFLTTILRMAGERDELRVVADQFGAPTWARLVAEVTALALQQELTRRKSSLFKSGTFNLTAAGETSWHEFASAIITAARERGATLKCRKVVPITSAEYPLPAARPANSRLSGAKLARHYGLEMPEWESCMHHCLEELLPA